MIVGDLHHVELRGDARGDVLAGRGGRGEERVIVRHQRHDERFDGFGEGLAEGFAFGVEHLAHAGDFRGGVGGGLRVVAGDEHVDIAADRLALPSTVLAVTSLSEALSCSAITRTAMIRWLPRI